MSEAIFRNMHSALINEDRVTVVNLTDDVYDALKRRSTQEQRYETLARRIGQSVSLSDAAMKDVNRYLTATTESRQARIKITQSLMEYLYEETSGEVSATAFDDGLELFGEVDTAKDRLGETKSNLSLGPILSLTSTERLQLPKGTTQTVSLSFTNLGTKPTDEVTLQAESEMDVFVESEVIENISENETMSVSIRVHSNEPGRNSVILQARTTQASTETRISVQVKPKTYYISTARGTVERLVSDIEDRRGARGVRNKLDTVANRLDQSEKRLQKSSKARDVNEKLQSAINHLGAALNQLDGNGTKLSKYRSAILQRDIEEVIETLVNGRQAEV